jgi:flagellar biosynthetic protein FlhB
VLRDKLQWFFALVARDAWAILELVKQVALGFMFRVGLAMVAVAAVDYLYQRYRHEQKLMMTKEEVKDERKEELGDPKVKQKQFERRMQMAAGRMRQAVPEADVVVTNPTHFAVALQWDEQAMGAPQVVAKGQDYVAKKIKELARENDVPVLERRELARALYAACEVGQEIPGDLYYAVAEVLAFVLRERKGRLRNVSA